MEVRYLIFRGGKNVKFKIMERKRIYISIPISGHDLEEVKEKARNIRELVLWDEFGLEKGWHRPDVITPFDVCPEPDKPYSYYMGKDIEALLECDAIYLCEGWQNSKGCMAEFEVARIYGKQIMFE